MMQGYLVGRREAVARRMTAREAQITSRVTRVLIDSDPTPEELVAKLSITPEDIIERFGDRIYDLREQIVEDALYGENDNEDDEAEGEEGYYDDDEESEEED
jgi:hypothetical protein